MTSRWSPAGLVTDAADGWKGPILSLVRIFEIFLNTNETPWIE